MDLKRIMSQFEFRLNDEVLQDLISPGRVCKHDLPIAHNDGQWDSAGMATGFLPSVQLEKLSDSVVRLWINVHRSTEAAVVEFGSQTVTCENGQVATQTSSEEWTKPGNTQTSNAEFVQVVTTQTDSSGSGVAITQTDGSGLLMNTTQTDGSGSLHGTTQTSMEEWTKPGNTQTNSAEFSNVNETQTDGCGMLSGKTQTDGTGLLHSITQTENVGSKAIITQTDSAEFSNVSETQTDGCGMLSGKTQTDGTGMLSGKTQTDGTGLLHSITQTENVGSKAIVTQTDGFACTVGSTQTDNTEWLFAAATQTDNSFSLIIGSTQTDSSEWLCVGATQTNSAEWHSASFTQWDRADWVTSCFSQTETRLVESSASQTIETRIGQTFTSTGVETLANLSTQVNTRIQATVDVTDNHCQATVSLADAPTQASIEAVTGDSQTELSLAWRSEQEVQATVVMSESTSQATVETSESMIQATVETSESTAQAVTEMAESTTQAVVDSAESEMQTVAMGVTSGCQTNVSMALELECGVQVCAEMSTGMSQTELFMTDSSSTQTEVDTSQQVDGGVQAVASLNDSQSESDTPSSSMPKVVASSSERELSASQGSEANQTFDEFGTSLLSQSVIDASFSTAIEHHAMMDGSSQTDPVTIIIGDASFLVKKLKSSAVSPSKVVTYGNEIEIEVNPDIVGDSSRRSQATNVAPTYEEKENDSLTRKTGAVQSFQSPSGVMVRGGAGPRLRMPVSGMAGASQQQRVVSTRTPGGLLVRHPVALSPGSVISPRTQMVTPTTSMRGPQPVTGSSMSCPFCALGFVDSAALYEHLSLEHTVDQKTKWKQPKGREGKTIVPQKRSDGTAAAGEPAPPILTPVEPFNVSAAGVKYRNPIQTKSTTLAIVHNTNAADGESGQDAVLFEDPVEPEVVKKPRGRQQKSDGDSDFSEFSPPPTKRLCTTKDNDDDDGDDEEEEEEDEESNTPVRRGRGRQSVGKSKETKKITNESTPVSRRGGRTPRSQKK